MPDRVRFTFPCGWHSGVFRALNWQSNAEPTAEEAT